MTITQLQAQLQTVAPMLAVVLLVIGLLIGLAALRLIRKSRTDSYWRSRRQSGQRGWRLLQLCVFVMFASGLICTASSFAGVALRPTGTATPVVIIMIVTSTPTRLSISATSSITASHTPTALLILFPTTTFTKTPPPTQPASATLSPISASSTPTATSTIPPTLTMKATSTPTLAVTDSATLVPLPTSSPTPSPTLSLTPVTIEAISSIPTLSPPDATRATLSINANLSITALDREVSGKFKPVQPSTKFTAGFTRLYYFVEFSQMAVGVDWRGALYWNGTLIDHYERQWALETDGTGYFSFTQANGFQPGRYEIRLYVGGSLEPITTAIFNVSAP